MASLVSGIQFLDKFGAYRVLFPFLLIFAITYGVLSRTDLVGENKTVGLVISFVVAFVFVLSANAVQFINTLIPFFVAFMLIVLLILLVTAVTGVKLDALVGGVKKGGWVGIVIILVILTLVVSALVFPQFNPKTREAVDGGGPNNETGGAYETLGGTIDLFFTPTVLGLIVLFIIFAAAAYFMTLK